MRRGLLNSEGRIKRTGVGTALLLLVGVLAACGSPDVQVVVVTQIVDGPIVKIEATPERPLPLELEKTIVIVDGMPIEVEVSPAVDAEALRDGNVLILCMTEGPETLNPLVVTNTNLSNPIMMTSDLRGWFYDRGYFYETQALVDNQLPSFENGDVVMQGEGEDAALSVTFHYKDSITWSDGEPFTVEDILFTREIVLQLRSGVLNGPALFPGTSYIMLDEHTLQVSYPAGVIDPLYFLPPLSTGLPRNMIGPLPEHVLGGMTAEEIFGSEYARLPNPVLGPYEYVEELADDHLLMRAVDDWWGGPVQIPNILFRFIDDPNIVLASLLGDECDVALPDSLPVAMLPFLQAEIDQSIVRYDAQPSLIREHIDFNQAPPPDAERDGLPLFADRRVREAVSYGTNRARMVDQIFHSELGLLNSYLPPDHWAYNPELDDAFPYDPAVARDLLEEAGWVDEDGDGVREAARTLNGEYSCQRGRWAIPPGTELSAEFHTTSGNAMRDQLVVLFQDDMAEIGIEIEIALLPASIWFADDGPLFTRTYQIGEFAWVTTPDPSALFAYLGQNVYQTPEGERLVAETILADNPDLLDELDLTAREFIAGRPTREQLGDYWLVQTERIPDEEDGFEGMNNLAWCNAESDQALYDGDRALRIDDQLPHYLAFQRVYAEDMPSIPLFTRMRLFAYAPDLCGPEPGPANVLTWNVEDWYFADECS